LPIFDCQKNQRHNRIQKLRFGMACVMEADAFRQKSLASALATAREGGASAFCPHPRPKTVLALARSLRWLKSAFHRAEK